MKRPQFSLRDLIWLILLSGLAMGWYLDHRWHRNVWLEAAEATDRATKAELEAEHNAAKLAEAEEQLKGYLESYGPQIKDNTRSLELPFNGL
jgi:hypothetical protein